MVIISTNATDVSIQAVSPELMGSGSAVCACAPTAINANGNAASKYCVNFIGFSLCVPQAGDTLAPYRRMALYLVGIKKMLRCTKQWQGGVFWIQLSLFRHGTAQPGFPVSRLFPLRAWRWWSVSGALPARHCLTFPLLSLPMMIVLPLFAVVLGRRWS
jgi:hypothetical protein